jgi:hypothetical protein
MSEEEKPTFVTDDQAIQKKVRLDPADVEIMAEAAKGGGIPVESMEQFEAIAKALTDTFNDYRKICRDKMTHEQATYVRLIRVVEGYSWRAVASSCAARQWDGWPVWEPPSSQPMGMALCERAASFFGENYRKEPWN